jgi:hypothetical protein
MTMPFGKYTGWRIEELPDDYLDWLYTQADIRSKWLRSPIKQEYLARRSGERGNGKNPAKRAGLDHIVAVCPELFAELVQCGYRKLAQAGHPDHGGSLEKMRQLNSLVESLRQYCGRKGRKL